MSHENVVVIGPPSKLKGDLHLPGDKSISHRSAMFAAIGSGNSRIKNYSSARDCQSTLDCLELLGVTIRRSAEAIEIEGVGINGLKAPSATLDVGNSGTTIRLLSGILAGQNFTTHITGDESIQSRPMKRVIDPLTLMGARIEARESKFAPLIIHGGGLKGISYQPPVASAQVKSCVLLAGLFASGETSVVETTPTRDHTEIMLRQCGVDLRTDRNQDGTIITIKRQDALNPLGEYRVAGDLSSAAFFLAAAILVPNSELKLRHIGINPSRMGLIDVLQSVGARISVIDSRLEHGEPVADFLASTSELEGDLDLDGDVIANLIDEIPILAVIGTRLKGTMTIHGAAELRVKESDRIRSIVDNLRALGVEVEEFDDGFRMHGPQRLKGAVVDSYGDHRIAMSAAVAGLIASEPVTILRPEAAGVSLPEFYQLLESLR